MKKLNLCLLLFLYTYISNSQNLGINKTNPTESLDVNGNINLSGTIKANGVDGLANQVLMKNSTGAMVWGNLADYKNFKMYSWAGANQTFTVPTGVTKLAVELWGAGGGGSPGGGGGAGGYAVAIFNVSAGQVCNIIVGNRGNGYSSPTAATDGNSSSFTNPTTTETIGINGGFGGFSSFPGSGGSIFSYSNGLIYIYLDGQSGKKNSINYQQNSPTTFVKNIKYGSGGTSPLQFQAGGEGGYSIEIVSGGAGFVDDMNGAQGYSSGEGGGGGRQYGGPGGYGRVIVRW